MHFMGIGEYSLGAFAKQVASAKQTLISTKAILGNYQLRISLLKSNHLDADMLDERARVMVGLVGRMNLIFFMRGLNNEGGYAS